MNHNQGFLLSANLAQAFNRVASDYDQVALIQREIAQRLLACLDPGMADPQLILDLGAGTGFCYQTLVQHYPHAHYLLLDISEAMLRQAQVKVKDNRLVLSICADAQALPLRPQSVDLMVSNLLCQWLPFVQSTYQAWQAALKPGGIFLFSTLGPDTLRELRESFKSVDNDPHVHTFIDMHHYGDMLDYAGFSHIVMQSEKIVLRYEHPILLCRDLQAQGVSYQGSDQLKGLMGVQGFQRMLEAYKAFQNDQGDYLATYEVIYGYAKAPLGTMDPTIVSIPIQAISKRA